MYYVIITMYACTVYTPQEGSIYILLTLFFLYYRYSYIIIMSAVSIV